MMLRYYILFFSILFIVNFSFTQFFENIAPQQGIEHTVNTNLTFGGHGVSFFDFNKDGWDDITFVQEDDSILFYINNEGIFEKMPSTVFFPGETRQVIWVDFDNDGDYDLFITATNGLARLLENDGQFNFTDITIQAGLSAFNANNYGVSFADFDNDGFLDFYLARYTMEGSLNNPNHLNALYRNNGDGTFTDVTQSAGVGDSLQPSFMGVWIDVNHDAYPDLYVINDRVLWGNSLYLNNGDGTFTDFTNQSGLSMFGEDPMGAMVADYNNDGELDVLLSNGGYPTKPPRFYINNGDSTFLENAGNLGINVPVTFMCTWGGTWFDMDNDSYLDLYLTTGLLMPASGEVRSYLFHSQEAQYFVDSPNLFDYDHIAASYSVAKGDINNDGYADLVVQNAKDYNSFIWKNNYGPTTGNNYIKITPEGTKSNKMAIGTWIKVYTDGQVLSHYTRCGENFVSQDSEHHIFGVKNANTVDSIEVKYQSGHTDTYYDLPVNQHYYFQEGETLNASLEYIGNGNYCEGDTIELSLNTNSLNQVVWSTGDTSNVLQVVESGFYFAEITSVNGIVYYSDSTYIEFLTQPTIIPTVKNISCFGQDDGEIELSVFYSPNTSLTGSIEWENGSISLNQINLFSGYHKYEFTFASCVIIDSVFVDQPSELELVFFTSPDYGNGGELDFMAFGGAPPYQLYIDDSLVGASPLILSAGGYELKVSDQNDCIKIYNIEIQNLASNNPMDNNHAIKIHPIPTTSNLSLSTDMKMMSLIYDIKIIDATGREVNFISKTLNTNDSIINFDVSGLPNGVYQLRIIFENGLSLNKKFVKS